MITINENTLSQHPLAEGGEGVIYEWENNTLLKLFKAHINKEEKQQKIQRLLTKNLPTAIVKPIELVYNQKGEFIGYSMKKVEGDELRKLSNKKYVSLNRITVQDILFMFQKIQRVLKTLHAQHIYIGDLNDSNILFDTNNDVYFIDVDSWAVDEFPCQVCMETFKDPLLYRDKFNEQTDCYAFSILLFKSLTRLHPFGGTTSPELDVLERMKKGISVIGNSVKIPRNVSHWSFFSPKLTQGLQRIFNEKNRALLEQEVTEFAHHLTFCNQHGDYYFGQYQKCPICHEEANLLLRPTALTKAGNIPLTIRIQPQDIRLFINAQLYHNTQNEIVHIKSKKTIPYQRDEKVYFSQDGHILYRVTPSKIEVHVKETHQISVFEKVYRSPVVIEDDVFYYQGNNQTFQRVHVSKKGNTTKVLAKTSFHLDFHATYNQEYLLVNHYDHHTIFNIDGYHYTYPSSLDAQKTVVHFDAMTKRWLVLVETKSGNYRTFVFDKNTLVFESSTLKYHAPIQHVCFSNNTIFTPQEGFIRGLQVEKFQYKDFPCAVVNENSVLTRKEKQFVIVNEKEIYTFG